MNLIDYIDPGSLLQTPFIFFNYVGKTTDNSFFLSKAIKPHIGCRELIHLFLYDSIRPFIQPLKCLNAFECAKFKSGGRIKFRSCRNLEM